MEPVCYDHRVLHHLSFMTIVQSASAVSDVEIGPCYTTT